MLPDDIIAIPVLPTGPILVAVSGGADSTALLHVLRRQLDPVRHPIVVAHLHHGIRGEEADADARFVEALAQGLGLTCVVERADAPAEAARSGESIEMAARRLRHAFLQRVAAVFKVEGATSPALSAPCSCAMYLGGRWRRLTWRLPEAVQKDPVSQLDVSRLQEDLLAPILGIGDPRTDTRIFFVGGIRGNDELVRLVDSGQAAVAFAMFPTTLDQMMAIADAGQTMPPKSTWFEPKLRSGLLVHTLD